MANDMSKNGVRKPSGGPKLNHKNSLVNGFVKAEVKVKPQEWVKMSFHALKSDNISFRNMQKHITLLSTIRRDEHMHRTDLVMIMKLHRMSDMITNVCCAAKASQCQHAGLEYVMQKDISRNDTWCRQSPKKETDTAWLWLWQRMPQLLCVRKHVGQRQSKNEGWGRGNEWMHASSSAGALEMKPPRPGKRPYFQIHLGFRLSWGWRPPPKAGPRGTLD